MEQPNQEQFLSWSEDLYRFVMDMMDCMKQPHDYGTGSVMNMVEMHTLALIDTQPGISVGEVARRWNRTMGAASRNIDRLCAKGLVEKKKEDGNEKTIHLYSTQAGQHLAAQHRRFDREQTDNFVKFIEGKCDRKDIESFHNVMRIIWDFYCH